MWYSVDDRLQLGAAYLWKQKAFRGLGSYKFLAETAKTPALVVGAGLQGIGTGNPGYFLTAEKNVALTPGALTTYLGVGFRSNEDHPHMIGGAKFTPAASNWTLGAQADGHNVSPFITHGFPEVTVGLYLIGLKTPGVLVSKRW